MVKIKLFSDSKLANLSRGEVSSNITGGGGGGGGVQGEYKGRVFYFQRV